jgi:hypothetical protein
MNAISRDHAGAASGMLVTLSGLGASLGVAVTGAIFNQLQTDRTVIRSGDAGLRIDDAQARELEGVLADTPGARQSLERIAGDKSADIRRAVREAFVDALGTSLKLSAGLIAVGLVLTLLLMRRTSPVDATPPAVPVLGAPTPRPAPRTGVG